MVVEVVEEEEEEEEEEDCRMGPKYVGFGSRKVRVGEEERRGEGRRGGAALPGGTCCAAK